MSIPTMIREEKLPYRSGERVELHMKAHPDVLRRLTNLLFEPELHAVGYSEFLERAIEVAEGEIMAARVAASREHYGLSS